MLENLFNELDNKESTLIIAPYMYHQKIIEVLTKTKKVLFNIKLLDINSFLKMVLKENEFDIEFDASIIEKLRISQEIDKEAININYINDYYLLKKECYLSNIDISLEDKSLVNKKIDFNNMKTQFDKIIVLTRQDFYPIHDELLNVFNDKVIDYKEEYLDNTKELVKLNNTANILDYIVYQIYQDKNFDNTLILCDNQASSEYFVSRFREFNIPCNALYKKQDVNVTKLNILFKILNNNYKNKDKVLINNTYDNIHKENVDKGKFVDGLLEGIKDTTYHQYLEKVYYALHDLWLFKDDKKDKLDNLFKSLYQSIQSDDIDRTLLNELLQGQLESILESKNTLYKDAITLAPTSYNALVFDKVYVVDASLPDFKQKKLSPLLKDSERNEYQGLLNVAKYSKYFIQEQKRLINCGKEIIFLKPDVTLSNKPSLLPVFIDELFKDKEASNKDYKLLFKSEPEKDKDNLLKPSTFTLEQIQSAFPDNQIKISSSSLNAFGGCQYKYLLSSILKIGSKDNTLSNTTLGSIYHEILKKVNQALIDHSKGYDDITIDFVQSIIDDVFYKKEGVYYFKEENKDNELVEKKLDVLDDYTHSELDTIRRRIVFNIVEDYKYLKFKGYKFISAEDNFELDYKDHYRLNGKIDLILENEDGSQYVVDFKSSENTYSKSKFKNKQQNQLPMYYKLLKGNDYNITNAYYKEIPISYIKAKNIITSMDEYYKILFEEKGFKGLLRENAKSPEQDLEEIESILNENLGDMIDVLENNGLFDIKPYTATGDYSTCGLCEYKAICHFQYNGFNSQIDENSDEGGETSDD